MVPVIDMPTPTKRPFLEKVVFHGIVFNMSWEDPEMDRRAFQITPTDRVVSITSAACNPLNILCQNPRSLTCVDGNPAQNAILELKLAGIMELDHEAFYDIFAARKPSRVLPIYATKLRPHLTRRSQRFWDRNLRIVAQGLYRHGRTGLFYKVLRAYLRILGIDASKTEAFFECQTLDEQRAYYYEHIAPRLWRRTSRAFMNFKPLIWLAGVHPSQFRLVDGRHDIYEYIKERMEYALTHVPIHSNYFFSQAVTGRFRGGHVPPYLLAENFEALKNNVDRVTIVNGWLGPHLDTLEPGSIDKFNLLDIFDWMPDHVIEQTFQSILRAASPGATLIYRSGSYRLEPPAGVRPYLRHQDKLSKELLAIDRSAAYGSFYVFTVQDTPYAEEAARTSRISA